MNEAYSSRIGDLRQRIADLQHHASRPDVQTESLIERLGELSAVLEGLARAEQRLRRENAELTAACRAAEAERQRTEESVRTLREERDRFKAIVENTHTQLAYLDPQFNFVWVNPSYALGSGHSKGELMGRNHFYLFPHPENQAIFEQVVETGQAVAFHARPFEYADQPERGVTYWDWTLVPIENDGGRVKGLVLSLLEVTEKRRAEAALRTSEETARALLNAPTDVVSLIDTQGVILDVNETMARRFDKSADQLIGQCVWDLFSEEFVTSRKARVEQVIRSGEPLRYEDERQGIWNDNVLYPILDEAGNVGRIAVIARDITEHKRAEARLREQNEFIVHMFESLAHPFYVVDVNDYTVVIANSAAYRGELPKAVTCYALTHGRGTPCNDDEHLCPIHEIRKTGKPVVMEHVHYDGEGKRRIFEVHGHPVFDQEGEIAQIIEYTLDVTERRQAEIGLEERTHELGERVKELNCLYGISALVEQPGISLEEILQGTTELLPPAWQYPEITGARITLGGQEFRTEGFSEAAIHQQVTAIIVNGQRSGTVEVCYLEESRAADEGPFLKEERSLIKAIAERLGKITERMQAQAALRESERRYRQLIESAQEGVWTIDADARTTFVNARMAEMLGYSVEEMLGKHLFAFMDERGVEISQRNLERRQRGISEQHDFELMRKDGSRIYTSMETSPITDEAGNYIGALALVADITERRRAEEALSTLLDISHQLALTVEFEPLLNLILEQLEAVVDYDDATIYLLEQETLIPLAHRGIVPHEEIHLWRLPLEPARFAQRVIFEQEVVILSDIHGDGPLTQGFREMMGEGFNTVYAQARSWMGVPLTIKDQVTGILALQHSEREHFTPRQAELVSAFANQAAVAIENNRLYQQTQELAALEERQRLARDLHDAVSQTLFSASLAAEVLPRLWEHKPDEGRRCLEELRHLTRSALAEMRTLLLELRPTALAEVELGDLLHQLVEAVTGRARLPVTLTIDGKCSLAPDVHVTLYRIAQEGLSNVIKHAGASRATMSLRCVPAQPSAQDVEATEAVELRIEDDGQGFDPQSVPAECLGLRIMRERADNIGAAIRIESQLGHGTQVVFRWPVISS